MNSFHHVIPRQQISEQKTFNMPPEQHFKCRTLKWRFESVDFQNYLLFSSLILKKSSPLFSSFLLLSLSPILSSMLSFFPVLPSSVLHSLTSFFFQQKCLSYLYYDGLFLKIQALKYYHDPQETFFLVGWEWRSKHEKHPI